ncbi:MAG: type II toxin-antitoxin system Phd/YefM family antitoxin [Caulobacteraceae bacterium]|nr:type II toxin-antitoxin system Phd/YefM family antitoxin [Caulobacteraceae bacterium]
MTKVDVLEAKTHLCRLIDSVESGREPEIVIARGGRPVAKLVALSQPAPGKRIGVAEGLFDVPEDIDVHNPAILRLFKLDVD